jgi:hypothetical protein
MTLRGVVAVAGLVAAWGLPPAAHAQSRFVRVSGSYVFSPPRPGLPGISVQTTVSVPNGGEASLGSYSRISESRNEFGVPILGKVPYVNRGFRNVGYGRSVVNGRVSVRARVFSLRDEEYRQTGFRSP